MASRTIVCPSCGETEELSGAPSPEGIVITCGRCHASWLRDSVPDTCATCGGTDVQERTRALTQYSRGTQLSIVGLGSILLCRQCDARMFAWSESGRPVPFAYKSAAMDSTAHEAGRTGDDVHIDP
ncbi:MAG: hypothetical protein IBX63_09750 [Coriobacteriia bacterium]|nr:hypothetical protein [Coriobacteriia bacterium]